MNRADNKSLDPREVELKLQLLRSNRAVLEASNVFGPPRQGNFTK
jgi:hypothetical protein